MTITWLGHSCFALESGGYRVVIDPYQGVEGLPDTSTEANAVYCSHQHGDHAYTQGVRITEKAPSPFSVREVATCHDDQGGSLRGPNTVRCFTAEWLTVAHLGDLGHRLTAAQVEAIGPCYALLLPVGGYYTIDAPTAKAVAEQLRPRVIIPMHYRFGTHGLPVIGTVEDFTSLYPPQQVHVYDTSTFSLTADTAPQVAVLAYGK